MTEKREITRWRVNPMTTDPEEDDGTKKSAALIVWTVIGVPACTVRVF